jgi:hypothetical protein
MLIGLAVNRLHELDGRGLGVHRAHINAQIAIRIDDEAAHEHVTRTERLAELDGGLLVHAVGVLQILLFEQRLQTITLHHTDGLILRDLVDEHFGHPLAQGCVGREINKRAVGEVQHRDGWAGIGRALCGERQGNRREQRGEETARPPSGKLCQHRHTS